uniref:Glucose-methanol-choline oxidoreductase N-terminal domain-containing protein n=1 Tax=Chromera velia CCMP2878 TaxID=1169474 RepID=A0A0G4HVU2_9ALVE|eukprot:Cvel_32382.t1-p1 / transcript=Cvel_32382.t1 / gene=Cvel_32382 / organism=Chromera_velia_CCMP2878 / gene_product=L-sorbose 1-dehydrogenase, putative / transcript_product=L-sorbose 1-dehydrogenase, putative / location=Cvel_scaffold5031:491-2932(+) / protein_length=618 / sequence_SO=supercontig / SO=protein_coding / is_pseudo=false
MSADFIVVGGGSAGAVVAARLSEDPNVSVLLLEAGGKPNTIAARVPAACGDLQQTQHVWNFVTEEQEHSSKLLEGKRVHMPSGKCLGGSSQVNYMAYVRGHRSDFDSWAESGPFPEWSWDSMLPFFKKAEDCRLPRDMPSLLPVDPSVHGRNGPISVSTRLPVLPASEKFVTAAKQAGHAPVDYNAGEMMGVSLHQMTIRDGRRCGTYEGYLAPIMGRRPNLRVLTGAMVHRVLFEDTRAVGVEFSTPGVLWGRSRVMKAKASKEVILCAGAVGSAKLLMLSGVGDSSHLKEKGVALVQHNPHVGQHLQDHCMTLVAVRGEDKGKLGSLRLRDVFSVSAALQWLTRGHGPLASSAYDASVFLRSGLSPEHPGPDVQIGFFASAGKPEMLKQNLRIESKEFWKEEKRGDVLPLPHTEVAILVPTLLRPLSEGTIKLRDADPLSPPQIDPKYLSVERDRKVLAEGVRRAVEIIRQPALASDSSHVVLTADTRKEKGAVREEAKKSPDTRSLSVHESTETLDPDRVAQGYTLTVYHPVATCRMGEVVDGRLRVRGLEGLRVCDNSVAPKVVSANTNALAIAIGERGASIIQEDWQGTRKGRGVGGRGGEKVQSGGDLRAKL